MSTYEDGEFGSRLKRAFATRSKGQLLIGLSLLLAGLAGEARLGPTAFANDSSAPEEFASAAEYSALNNPLSSCGTLSVDGYISHDSALLKESFCELLTFTPFSLSGIESFFNEINPGSFSSNNEPSAEEMTLPSLWWSQNSLPRQFGSYRLVESWTAYEIRTSATRVVDIHVNPQIWRILQYSERYGALSHLAEEAKAFQYNLRIFNNNLRDPRLIGLYVCDFPTRNQGPQAALDDDAAFPVECAALIDAETIVRLQASLANSEGLAQQEPLSTPTTPQESVVGSTPSTTATETTTDTENDNPDH